MSKTAKPSKNKTAKPTKPKKNAAEKPKKGGKKSKKTDGKRSKVAQDESKASRSSYGSPRKVASGRWQARVLVDGVHRNPTPGVTYATKDEANRAAAVYKSEDERGVALDLTKATLEECYERWWETKTDLAPSTRQSYRSTFDMCVFRPWTILEDIMVRDITPKVLREWLVQLQEPWVHPETGRDHKAAGGSYRTKAKVLLSQVLDHAVEEGLIHRNPAVGVEPAPRGALRRERRKHFYLYLDEIQRIVAAAYEEDVAWGVFFEVLSCSGMRPGELRALWPEQVFAETRSLFVNASVSEGGKPFGRARMPQTKNGKDRWTLLPQPTMNRLLEHIERVGAGPQDLVWTNTKGTATWSSTMEAAWQRACLNAGVWGDPTARLECRRVTPWAYDLRAAYISHLLASGLPSIEVRDLVGHGDDDVTDMYTVVQRAGAEEKRVITARTDVRPMTRENVVDYLYSA